MAATTSAFRMADRMAGGRLVDELRRFFEVSRSWEQVSRDLYASHGIEVTGQTLRRWAKELDLEAEVA